MQIINSELMIWGFLLAIIHSGAQIGIQIDANDEGSRVLLSCQDIVEGHFSNEPNSLNKNKIILKNIVECMSIWDRNSLTTVDQLIKAVIFMEINYTDSISSTFEEENVYYKLMQLQNNTKELRALHDQEKAQIIHVVLIGIIIYACGMTYVIYHCLYNKKKKHMHSHLALLK